MNDASRAVAAQSGETTLRSWILGLGLSAVLGAANVYLGLKVGMTVSAAIPASVIAMLVLRRVLRGGTILEANMVQTAASAGESLAAGILFTVPALVLVGFWREFDYWTTTLIALAGGWLGVLFMIPLRPIFIENNPELPYPEGVACALVLRAGMAEGAAETGAARSVLAGGLLGGLVKLAVGPLGLAASVLEGAVLVAGRPLFLGAEISPALVAVGAIVRLEVAAQIGLGGLLGGWVVLPFMGELAPLLAPGSAALRAAVEGAGDPSVIERAMTFWSQGVRYVGVGAMAVGGVAALVRVRTGLARAVGELRAGWGARAEAVPVDLSGRVLLGLALFSIALTGLVYLKFTQDVGIALLATLLMVVACFFFVGVASYIVGLVGNSNSPVSGMTITAVLATGAILLLAGYSGMQGIVATLGVAAIVCCAACTAGDVCNDLKTGSLVGATPWRQQAIQLGGVAIAAFVMAPVLQLLDDAYGIGSRALAAPQASLFASLTRGFFGDESLPWGLVGLGAGLGVAILVIDGLRARRGSTGRLHLMPIAVGLYLPLGLSLPIVAGGLIELFARRRRERTQPRPGEDEGGEAIVLFASGAVAGEALVGVALALLVVLGVGRLEWAGSWQGLGAALGALIVLVAFWRAASQAPAPRASR